MQGSEAGQTPALISLGLNNHQRKSPRRLLVTGTVLICDLAAVLIETIVLKDEVTIEAVDPHNVRSDAHSTNNRPSVQS